VNLQVKRGEWLAIVGPSSSGKTLLLRLIGGFQKASAGSIRIEDQDITRLDKNELAAYRVKMIGYIPQKYELINYMSVIENVYLPMIFAGYPEEMRIKRGKTPNRDWNGRSAQPSCNRYK